jgi:enediyne biosynthesis protein E3
MEGSIAERIDRIVETFKAACLVAEANGYSEALLAHLESADAYYRSVAFEGAAMGLAKCSPLSFWNHFMRSKGLPHAVQVHVGLGWYFAERQEPVPTEVRWLDRDSILDGYGYYMGLFRRRLSIRTHSLPDWLTDAELPAFDRGVGRSLWYISKGDVEQLAAMVYSFPDARQPHLWRGVGIAVAYVGGCSETLLGEIASAASVYRPLLLEGAERALRSRTQAGTPTNDAQRTVQAWS